MGKAPRPGPVGTDLEPHAPTRGGQSMVSRTVRRLAQLSLAAEEGAYLGSENELIQRLEVSRPTLRQAAKVAESDRLLSVRRGVNGGFYAARPDARHVVRSPALYLRLQSATMQDMLKASDAINPVTAAEAAHCDNPELIARLQAFRDALDTRRVEEESLRETMQHEVELARLIGQMSCNPVLMLFTDITYAFGLLEKDFRLSLNLPERRVEWMTIQRGLCDAILDRDPEIARVLCTRRGRLITAWLKEDDRPANAPVPSEA